MQTETIDQKLKSFYQDYKLGNEGGNHLPYVTIEISKFLKFYIPNWDERRKAVLRHDIHHLVTGYKSELLGEFEIAAWEIASGCMNYFSAYLLNSGGLIAGILFYPKPTFKAFGLGCQTTNLYQVEMSDEKMKSTTIDEMKTKLGFNDIYSSIPKYKILGKLVFHLTLSFILNCLVLIFIPFLILFNIWMYGKKLF